jgi:hypothetical protein
MFFGITLFCLEEMRKGKRWPAFVMIIIMAMWANIHGGFVSGLGIIAIYAIAAILARRMVRITLATLIGCVLVTFANPYGIKLWQYLIPALLHQRSTITEWQPMPLFGFDIFVGFRILFIFALVTAIVGWRNLKEASSPASVIILLVTAYLGFRHKRHAPFFALAAAAFLGPYLEAALGRIRCRMPASLFKNIRPILILFIIYSLIAAGVALFILPDVSFQILVHAGFFPVRATDILMYSKASGNLVIPLEWGSYAMWRLYPRIKISMCGRYETIYPASTFQMNQDFFLRSGENWDRLCRQYKVDFIILNLTYTRLRASDIDKLGFGVVWSDGYSALFAREGEVAALRDFTRKLPYQAAQTFDDRIPDSWWKEAQE